MHFREIQHLHPQRHTSSEQQSESEKNHIHIQFSQVTFAGAC